MAASDAARGASGTLAQCTAHQIDDYLTTGAELWRRRGAALPLAVQLPPAVLRSNEGIAVSDVVAPPEETERQAYANRRACLQIHTHEASACTLIHTHTQEHNAKYNGGVKESSKPRTRTANTSNFYARRRNSY